LELFNHADGMAKFRGKKDHTHSKLPSFSHLAG
jgi:hypothetical protein